MLCLLALLKAWGWNGGHIRSKSWSNPELAHSLQTDKEFQTAVLTWKEQRSFVTNAVAALPPQSPLARAIAAEFAQIMPSPPAATAAATAGGGSGAEGGAEEGQAGGYEEVAVGAPVACGPYTLVFRPDGAIESMADGGGADYASPAAPLARVWYQGIDHADVKRYSKDYVAGASIIIPEIAAENLVKVTHSHTHAENPLLVHPCVVPSSWSTCDPPAACLKACSCSCNVRVVVHVCLASCSPIELVHARLGAVHTSATTRRSARLAPARVQRRSRRC
jgi:hypothetical protein